MKTILIVDDERDVTDVVAATLEDEGYRVLTAHNGLDGLKCLSNAQPDMVICDFMMPLMTGLELAEAIRADGALRHTPILLVSGAQGAIARERADLFDLVLDKPYDIDRILEAVAQLEQRP